VLALLFAFLELLKTYRSSLWSGGSAGDWMGAALGLGLYAGVFGGLTEGLWAALRAAAGKRARPAVGVPLCAVLGAAGVWVALSVHREYAPTLDDALVAAALLGLAAGAIGLPSLDWMSLRAVLGAAGVALAAGIAAIVASGHVFLFHPDRTQIVTIAGIAWLALAGLVVLAAWGFCGFSGTRGCSPLPLARTRRIGLSVVLIGLPFAVMHVATPNTPRSNAQDRPNVVLIVLDTLRADYCSAYGGPCPTPALAALAQRGARFDRPYALSPWTPPSMTGLFASTYPPGLTPDPERATWLDEVWRYALRPEDQPVADRFAAAGYDTCALVANPMLRGMAGMLRGFETTRFPHPMIVRPRGPFNYFPLLQDTLAAWCPSLIEDRYQDTTADVTRYAVEYLRRHRSGPFFLWAHYIDPHAPYDPPDAYRTGIANSGRAFVPHIDNTAWVRDVTHEKPLAGLDEPARAEARSLYEGEVRYVDAAVGRILAELQRLGLEDDTYVCVTSDHGEELWDHGGWGHGQTVYDELMRVPLIIAGPGVMPRTVETPVSAIDLIPTLAALSGVAPAASWQGVSLAPLLRGEDPVPPARPCFGRGTGIRVESEPLEMVVVGEYKLVRGVRSGALALYNVLDDPGEQVNLAAQHPDLVAEAAALLAEWRATHATPLVEFYGGEKGAANKDEMLEQLRAIGYL